MDTGFHRMDFGVVQVLDFWLTLGRTSKFVPPLWNKGGGEGEGGGGGWNPSPEFLIRYNISKRFWLKWKDFDLFNKMRYILWVVALRESLWRRQQWSPSWLPPWLLPRMGNQVKTARNGDFFVLHMKSKVQLSTLHDFSHKICFYCWKKLKKYIFAQKWFDHLLLMTSYLVTIATAHH